MPLDLAKTKYRLAVIAENNRQYNVDQFVTSLGWEENENEIAARISFTVRNDRTSKGRLSSLIKPGCMVGIFASVGKKKKEVARGYVTEWNSQEQNGCSDLKCVCYDALYNLQKSQDNKYFPSGTGTKSIITGIFKEWGIPTKTYSGPNVAHGKLKFNNSYVSDMLLETLDDAHKKGAGRYILRAEKGYADVVEKGSNAEVYVFKTNITKSASASINTAGLVTRVKIIGKADDEGNSSVEAVLDGETKYGLRQRIYTRGSDESLEAAKSSAQEILDEEGEVKQNITLNAPDVPFIRKGDLAYVAAGIKEAYYYVKSVRHDCGASSMTLEVEYAGKARKKKNKKAYTAGDLVKFKGGACYLSPYSDAKGYEACAGKAKITKIKGMDKAHPWHLIHTDSGNVYGWVDDGAFE